MDYHLCRYILIFFSFFFFLFSSHRYSYQLSCLVIRIKFFIPYDLSGLFDSVLRAPIRKKQNNTVIYTINYYSEARVQRYDSLDLCRQIIYYHFFILGQSNFNLLKVRFTTARSYNSKWTTITILSHEFTRYCIIFNTA